MLREMDLVEGDWAALFWALGSATALFKHLEAPMSIGKPAESAHAPTRAARAPLATSLETGIAKQRVTLFFLTAAMTPFASP
jgi:hypothetical protein